MDDLENAVMTATLSTVEDNSEETQVNEVDEGAAEVEENEDEAEESNAVDETEGTETVVEDTPARTIKAKYNGAEIEVPEDEAKELIQIAKFVKDNGGIEAVKWLKKQTKSIGAENVGDYIKAVQAAMEDGEVKKLVEEDMLPEDVAKELVSLRRAKAEVEVEEPYVKEVREFNSLFPGEDITKLPQSVLDAKKANKEMSITDLYLRYQHTNGKTKQKVAEQQQKNKATSTGSLKDTPDSPKNKEKDLWNAINSA